MGSGLRARLRRLVLGVVLPVLRPGGTPCGCGRGGFLLMYFLIGLAGIALLWFAASLRVSLQRVEPAPARLSTAAFAGGAASATLLLAGGATILAPFAVVLFDSREALDPTLYNVVSAMGFI